MLTDEGEGVTPEMVLPEVNSGANGHYYTLVSGATDDRAGRVIELVAEDSPLLTQFASNNVAVGRLWTNTPATEGTTQADYQAWCIEENPTTPGLYALVCKAKPEGSLTADPTETGTGGRWNYDNSGKHYHFVLGERAYGKKDGNYYYSIHSDLHTGIYLNSSKGGQGFSVNCYPDPTDGTAGQWCFVPLFGETETVEQPLLEQRHTYAIVNAVEGFEGITFAAEDGNTSLIHSDSKDAANAWEVTESTVNADGSQTVKLKNTIFSTYISSIGTYVQGYGRPVQTGESATAVKLVYNHATQAFRLKDDSNHSYYPATNGKVYAGANTAADVTYDASSRQGAEWNIIEVSPVTFKAQDSEGNSLGEFRRSIKADLDEVTLAECPELNNMKAVSLTKEDDKNYSVTYERTAYTLTLLGQDKTGAIVYKNEESVPLTESYTVKMPEVKYYEKVSADVADGEQLVLDEDRTIKFVYNTDALIGVKALGDFVTTQPEAGKSYVLLDDSDADGGKRRGYRKILLPSNRINRAVSVEEIGPSGVWTLEAADKGMKIKNSYTCLYVPDLIRSGATIASTEGGVFNFEQNTDGQTWCVKGLNGQMWDGTENGDLVGWNGGNGHPIRVFEFYSMPYYTVTYNCVDANNELLETRTKLLPAGSYYPLIIPFVQGMEIKAIEGNEDYQDCLEGFVTIKVVFQSIQEGIGVVESNRPSTDKHVIYDIQGRRLHTIKGPGLYIVGGRKVFVK